MVSLFIQNYTGVSSIVNAPLIANVPLLALCNLNTQKNVYALGISYRDTYVSSIIFILFFLSNDSVSASVTDKAEKDPQHSTWQREVVQMASSPIRAGRVQLIYS